MNRLAIFVLAVVIGAGGLWLYQRVISPRLESSNSGGFTDPQFLVESSDKPAHVADASSSVVTGVETPKDTPVVDADEKSLDIIPPDQLEVPVEKREPAPEKIAPTAAPPPPPAEDVLVLGGNASVDSSEKVVEPTHNPLMGADQDDFLDAYGNAEKAILSGDSDRGLEIYQLIFAAAKDRNDINITAVANKLLEVSSDEKEKLEYFRYLSANDTSVEGQYHSSFSAARMLVTRRDGDDVRAAWTLLTRAYLSARNNSERGEVLDTLNPFLKEHIFSRRFSPLLKKHGVKEGQSLSMIAESYQTTVDAIKRLNGLKKNIIRSGQRLLVLPGKVEIFIKKRDFRLWVLVDGKLLMERRVGLGMNNSTPEGPFQVQERQKNPIWYRQGEAPLLPDNPKNILGTRWLGFADHQDDIGIGIHGTRDNSSIGKEVSSGCIRLRNSDIEVVFDFVPRGTPVLVED